MAKEFINPNWHVILIHYPLGVFMLGMLLEVAFLVLRYHGSARSAARWMVVIGALSGLPAAYAGMYALADVARRTAPAVPDDAPWHAVANGSTLNADQWEMIESHVWTNGGAAVIAAVVATLAVACSDHYRRRLYPVFLLLLLFAAGAMSVGAWYGGEMVYREAIAVKMPYKEDERTGAATAMTAGSPAIGSTSAGRVTSATQPERTTEPPRTTQPQGTTQPLGTTQPASATQAASTTAPALEPASSAPAPEPIPGTTAETAARTWTAPTSATAPPAVRPDSPAAETQTERPAGFDYYVNPVQAHVALAGVAAAMGLLGIGLSLRATSTSPHWQDPELERAGVTALPHPQRGGHEDLALLRSFAPRVEVSAGGSERIPAARFWLLAFLAAAAASLAGWWVLGDEHETYRPQDLWQLVMDEGYVRRLAHVIAAGAIVVLPLFMSVLARVARRSRGAVMLFSALLAVAIGAQVWLGALLMFDQPRVAKDGGAWYRFQEAPAGGSAPSSTGETAK